MPGQHEHSDDSGIASPNLIGPYQALSAFTAGLVLLQAGLAGHGLYMGNQDYFDYHEIVGMLFLVSLLVQIAITWLLTNPGYWRRHLLIQNGLILILSLLLMWLGYKASDSNRAGAWHITLAVFIFGYASGVFSHAWGFGKPSWAKNI
ncbi:hypothetical protein BH23CHL5_BH23CHL5_17250 [soil metagenome]